MSLELDWDKLDSGVSEYVRALLQDKLQSTTSKPNFIGEIYVRDVDFGTSPPDVQVLDVTDPFPEFYLPDEGIPTRREEDETTTYIDSEMRAPSSQLSQQLQSHSQHAEASTFDDSSHAHVNSDYFSHQPMPMRLENEMTELQQLRSSTDIQTEIDDAPTKLPQDVQIEMLLNARGNDMHITIETELFIDFPSPRFLSLPVKLTITGIHLVATIIVAKLSDRINFCFLDPEFNKIEPPQPSRPRQSMAPQPPTILRELHIESEVGEKGRQVLKNVTKVERFVADQLRSLVEDNLVFPSYQSVIL